MRKPLTSLQICLGYAWHVFAKRGREVKRLGSFSTRKEAEECFKEHLREIAIRDGSDYIFGS